MTGPNVAPSASGLWRKARMALGGPVGGPVMAYVAVCVGLWPVPVVGTVHAEGAAVTAALSFFVAGVAGVGAFRRGEGVGEVARRHVALLVVPLALLGATALWRPNCGWVEGVGLWGAMVPPSALLGVALARALVAFRVPRPRLVLVSLGVALAAVPSVLALKLGPQLFVYNVIYGGVLGPIYDAELSVRPGLFAHRALTVLWAAALLLAAGWREGGGRAFRQWPLALVAFAVIATAYVFSTPLGFSQSEAHLRRALPARAASGGAVVHHAPGETPAARARALARDVAYRLDRLEQVLGARPRDTVRVYLYPDPETKGALLGSRETSVVPVWLGTPQTHLLDSRADGDLGHEVVHLVAREFGGRFTGATSKIGLVEGLAVALEPASGAPSAEQQTAAALTLPQEAGGLEDPAGAIVQSMSPLGFWGGRAGVAYTTTGAFVRWLLDTYGGAPIREVYGGATWREAFGVGIGPLADRWARHLGSVRVTPEAVAFAEWRFSQPSLFEVDCPHHLPPWRRALREADWAWDRGDVGAALAASRRARALAPDDDATRARLTARVQRLAMLGDPEMSAGALRATVRTDTLDLPEPRLALARAIRLSESFGRFPAMTSGDVAAPGAADSAYARAARALPPYALQARALVRLEAALPPEALLALLLPRPDSLAAVRASRAVARGGSAGARWAALLRAEAGDAAGAWGLWREAGAADDRGGTDAPVLDLVGARLALGADAPAPAEELAARAELRLRALGSEAAADVAAEIADQARWVQRGSP